MPKRKKQKTQAAVAGGRDTVYRVMAGFSPLLVARRPQVDACAEPAVGFWDAISGRVKVSPADITLAPEEAFVCGGQHTGERNPLRHWRIGAGGDPESVAESPLGAEFDAYFSGLPRELQVEHIEDKDGVHMERWLDPEFVRVRLSGAATLTANSAEVHEHREAAAQQVTEGLRSGQYTCLGTIGDWFGKCHVALWRGRHGVEDGVEGCGLTLCSPLFAAAHGSYPVTNAVSIEPEKPRLVTAPFEVNEAMRKQPVVLEGLNDVRENVRWGGTGSCPSQTGHDQKSGYNNLLISKVGRLLFVFAIFGHLFCENTVPFGCLNAACCQQRGSVLGMGFMRHLGALGSVYLDDSHLSSGLVWSEAPGPVGLYDVSMSEDIVFRLTQQSYAFEVMMTHFFGVWLSWQRKCQREPCYEMLTLGMVCDIAGQCFVIPDAKRRRFVDLARSLRAGLMGEGTMVDFYGLGRLAGQVMGFHQALPRARLYLTPLYGVITGARLHGDAEDERGMFRSAWWRKVSGTTVREVRREWLGPLRESLGDLIGIVRHPDDGAGTRYPFLRERHVGLRVQTTCHDTTLTGYGMYAEGLGADGLVYEMGGELVEELCGVELRGRQTGTTELAGVLQTFMGLVRDAALSLLPQARRLVTKMDNMEDVIAMQRYRVSGTQRVGKYLLMRMLFALFDRHGLTVTFEHVVTLLNKSDAASRLASFRETKMGGAVFDWLYESCGPFTIDYMSSVACAQVMPGSGAAIPYYSRHADAGSRAINVFRQDLLHGPGGKIEKGYCYPPSGMVEAFARLAVEARINVVFVLPVIGRPWPGWRSRLERHVKRTLPLPPDFAQKRDKDAGWHRVVGPVHEAVALVF